MCRATQLAAHAALCQPPPPHALPLPRLRRPAAAPAGADPPSLLQRLQRAGLSKRQAVALCGVHPLGRWWSAPAKYEELQPRLEGGCAEWRAGGRGLLQPLPLRMWALLCCGTGRRV